MRVRILMMKDSSNLKNTPLEEAIIGVNASWVAPTGKIENGPIAETWLHRNAGERGRMDLQRWSLLMFQLAGSMRICQ